MSLSVYQNDSVVKNHYILAITSTGRLHRLRRIKSTVTKEFAENWSLASHSIIASETSVLLIANLTLLVVRVDKRYPRECSWHEGDRHSNCALSLAYTSRGISNLTGSARFSHRWVTALWSGKLHFHSNFLIAMSRTFNSGIKAR